MTEAYRIDGRAVSATAFYAAACDPRRSVAVEACAGAGKTWMLVSRIVRALLDGAEPSQILAVTFTRKAAGEMRQRLDQLLQSCALPDASEAKRIEALVDRGLSPEQARAMAPALGDLHRRVLAEARQVEVRTFHGWFGQLLAQAPMEQLQAMGLAPGLQLIEDPESLRDDLMRGFHRAVEADPARREDYVTLVRRHRRHTVQAWLDSAWQRRTEVEAADAAGTLADSVVPAWDCFADCAPDAHPLQAMRDEHWRVELQTLASALGQQGSKAAANAAAGLIDALSQADARQGFDKAWLALFTKGGTPRKKMGDLPATARACLRLEALQIRARQQDAHEDHRRMVRLARVLLGEYAQLKRSRALADMGDLESLALTLLADGDLSAWIQARLDQRLRHLLIDEFQDTSPLQWQALHGWLSGYGGAGGGQALSVFIVGDPKQSIYRFRRAEPRVFAAAREFVAEALQGQVLECDHTRRNAPELIGALNTVFGDAASVDGWGGFRPHTTAKSESGRLLRLPVAPREASARTAGDTDERAWRDSLTEPRHAEDLVRREPEARQVAAAIDELMRQGVPPDKIMVLARRRAALSLVAQALAALHRPYTMPEALSLAGSAEARDLLALLDVLASHGHDLSLAHALRSPVFGVSDDDLLVLSRAAAGAGGWWHALMREDGVAASSSALTRARRLLASWATAAKVLPPHDLLDRIVHEGELPARLAAVLPARLRRTGAQAVDALLAASLATGGGRYSTPYGFVRGLRRDDLQVRLPAPPDAVRLLTVHGAKGLEADWVFVIDSDPQARAPERATLLVDWPTDRKAPRTVAFVAREGAIAPSLQGLLEEEQAARQREEINGLYVAMTRAAHGLVFSSTAARSPDARSWWARVQGLATDWVPTAPAGEGDQNPPARVPVLPALQMAVPASEPATVADPLAARIGQAVHRLLEWAGRPQRPLPRADWADAARAAAAQFGVLSQADTVLGFATEVLDSPDCARFFSGPALQWAGNEVPMAIDGQTLRLDRLVKLGDGDAAEWWVLDYKLGAEPEAMSAYRAQMASYVAAVRLAQPGESVRAAFITGQGRLVPSS